MYIPSNGSRSRSHRFPCRRTRPFVVRAVVARWKNHAYFQQFVRRGVPGRLPEDVRGQVAEILKVDERQLKIAGPKTATGAALSKAVGAGGLKFDRWIPIYGQAIGGKDDEFILTGNQVTEVVAPANLSNVPDAYAVYVVGDSMEPRYFAGETVFVNPRQPISKGAFVVAQISGPESEAPRAYVKRFVSQDSKRLRLEQYNPKKILEFPTAKVLSVHRIVMSSESK